MLPGRLQFLGVPSPVQWPFDAASPAHPSLVKEGKASAVHGFVPPATFLELAGAGPGGRWSVKRDPAYWLPAMERKDARFPVLYLDVYRARDGELRVIGHEGRHRAAAARAMGLRAVPVIFFFRRGKPSRGRPYEAGLDRVPEVNRLVMGWPVTMVSQRYNVPAGDESDLLPPRPVTVQFTGPGGETIAPGSRAGSMATRPGEPMLVSSGAYYLSRSRDRGHSAEARAVQDAVEALKAGDRGAARQAAAILAPAVLRGDPLVFPVPRSSAGRPSLLPLAEALAALRGGTPLEAIQRAVPVQSSRQRRHAGRLGAGMDEHAETMAVDMGPLDLARPVLLVDDVVTEGGALRGARQALRRAGHAGPVRAAAVGYYRPSSLLVPGEPVMAPRLHVFPGQDEAVARYSFLPVGEGRQDLAVDIEAGEGRLAAMGLWLGPSIESVWMQGGCRESARALLHRLGYPPRALATMPVARVRNASLLGQRETGEGLGTRLYLVAALATWRAWKRPFIYFSDACGGGSTSRQAARAWHAIGRYFPASPSHDLVLVDREVDPGLRVEALDSGEGSRSSPGDYPLLDVATVRALLPAMARQGVSAVARGPAGFTTAYLRAGAAIPGYWLARRDAFLRRHLAQVEARGEPLLGRDGAPTRRHLALAAWAYSPDPGTLSAWIAHGAIR